MTAKTIEGLFAPISTPFVNDELSVDHLRANLRRYRETHLRGFFALGSNGESKSLTEEEKLKVLEVVVEEKAPPQLIMAGAGCESTRQTIAFARKAASLGADYVSLITPSYHKKSLSDEAMIGYFIDVAEALTVPVLAYNAPGFTGMTLSSKVVEKISRHPNIVGMKDTSSDNTNSYLSVCAESFAVLAGTVSNLYAALVLGAAGGVVSLANAFPESCCELFEKWKSGDLAEARQLYYRLFRLNQSVSGSYGVAGVKYAMEVGGYFGGDPRRPLLPLSEEGKQRIREAVAAAGLS